jgi:hypothetical protein
MRPSSRSGKRIPSRAMRTQRLLRGLLFLPIAAVSAELGARAIGVEPWHTVDWFGDMPTMATEHPTLGWVNRPGSHRYHQVDGREITVNIAPDGRRQTPTSSHDSSIALFGGSFMFGFGLSDHETAPAQLAEHRPDVSVSNYSVPGYGTLQALGRYREADVDADVVVYGLVDLHDGRNAPARSWLRALEQTGPDRPWVTVPGARWDGHSLMLSPPTSYRHWALSEQLAVVELAERAAVATYDQTQYRTKSETTVQLVRVWRDEVEGAGGRFVVAMLYAPNRSAYYQGRMAAENIELLDLQDPAFPEAAIPGDGHPDASVHARWGKAMAESL